MRVPLLTRTSALARASRALVLGTAFALSACAAPDPAALLTVDEVETYWAVDPTQAGTRYIAPVVQFRLKNKGGSPLTSVQATAVFRHKGDTEQTWGSDYAQAASRQKPLGPGQEAPMMLKSDARYSSNGPIDGMFTHQEFKDASVDVFLRVGSSAWVKFATVDVERHVGSRKAQEIVSTPADRPPPADATPPATPRP